MESSLDINPKFPLSLEEYSRIRVEYYGYDDGRNPEYYESRYLKGFYLKDNSGKFMAGLLKTAEKCKLIEHAMNL